jgi:membrane-associated phospholipid phosphatase
MGHEFFRVITNFGDSAVVLPLTALLAGGLWYFESLKSAWLLVRALLACLLAMTVLKLLFLACGRVIGFHIDSPSGHTGLTVFFYGALAAVVWARPSAAARVLALVLATALVLLVAASRVVLGAHSFQEVLCGMVVGALSLAWFARPYLAIEHPGMRLQGIVLALVLVPALMTTYGMVLPVEVMLRHFAQLFRIGICAA